MNLRPNEAPLPEPLGFFLTWATYGTWLPGDNRGWIEYRHGWQLPSPARRLEAEARMTKDACILDPEQRVLVEKTIADHCQIRGWQLHAVNCRTNHLHVVVSAPLHPDEIRKQFKAWCTRRLKELERQRRGIVAQASANEVEPRVDERRSNEPRSDEPRSRVGFVSANTPRRSEAHTPTRSASEASAVPRSASEPTPNRATPGKGESIRQNWWAERGSRRYINDEHSLEAAILYVRDAQDRPR